MILGLFAENNILQSSIYRRKKQKKMLKEKECMCRQLAHGESCSFYYFKEVARWLGSYYRTSALHIRGKIKGEVREQSTKTCRVFKQEKMLSYSFGHMASTMDFKL